MELESLPEGWEIKELGDVCDILIGGTPTTSKREYWGGKNPWTTVAEMNNNIITKTTKYITDLGVKNSNVKLIPKGSVLVSFKLSIGKVAIAGIDLYTNEAIAALKIKDTNELDNDFLFYLIKKSELEKYARMTVKGKCLNKKILKSIPVILPLIEEQKKIVEILQFADYLKEKIREAKELIDKIVMSVFYDMFGDPATNPKGWEVKKMSEIADINPRNLLQESWNDEKEIGFIPMENINEETGEIRRVEIKKLRQVRSGKTRFREKDVLFAKITPCVENKKVALVRGLPSEIGFGSTEFHVIRAKDGITVPEFLLYLTRTDYVIEQAILSMTGTSGRKRVPASFLKNFDVPLPSLDLQQEFAEIVAKLEEKRRQMEEAGEKLEMLYQVLLKQAFTGKLTEEWRIRGNTQKADKDWKRRR